MGLEEIRARTERRKAAGVNQTYPQHAGKALPQSNPVKGPVGSDECGHRSASPTGTTTCATCAGRVELKVFDCAVHGTCTLGKQVAGHWCCKGCTERTALEPPAEPVATPSPDVERIRAAFVEEFRAEVQRCKSLAYPEGRYAGDGVVICAGGWKMLAGVFLTAQMLRWESVNSRLPIEVWYVGDEGEYDPIFAHITAGLNVTWRDASAELNRLGIHRRERLYGWALKPLALLLSSFERVVMLDADCYPVFDPERLWADPRVGDKPAAFWPDYPQNKLGRPLTPDQWSAFGLPPTKTPGFESGQMLVDKRKSWAAVNVAAFLSDRMDYFDATRADTGRVRIHGDKEAFSLAWNATATPYHMAPPVKYHEVAFLQHDPDGRPAFIHRCNDKPRIDFREWRLTKQKKGDSSLNYRSTTLPHERMVHSYLNQLRELIRPTLPGFRDGTQDEQIWREVRVANVYRLPERMDGMRVVDVGAHAGFFTHECCRRGAEFVLAVEPHPLNAALAHMNLAPWTARARFREVAVVAPGGGPVRLGEGLPGQTGEPHVAGPGTIPVTTLDELITECGRVDLLKIDAEGAEYPALLTVKNLAAVGRVAGEFHRNAIHRPEELRAVLETAGFQVEMSEIEGLGMGMFHAVRPSAT